MGFSDAEGKSAEQIAHDKEHEDAPSAAAQGCSNGALIQLGVLPAADGAHDVGDHHSECARLDAAACRGARSANEHEDDQHKQHRGANEAHVDSVESAGARGALKDSGGDASSPSHIGYGTALSRLQQEVSYGANGDKGDGVVEGDFGGKANALPRLCHPISQVVLSKEVEYGDHSQCAEKHQQGDRPVHQPCAGNPGVCQSIPNREMPALLNALMERKALLKMRSPVPSNSWPAKK